MEILFSLFLIVSVWIQDKPKSIEDFQWKNRLVLYFQTGVNSNLSLTDSLEHEIQERKIVYMIFNDSLFSNNDIDFSEDYIKSLHKKYAMGAKGSCWVLIGLDGGVKMRREEPIDWKLIFGTIDAMPMRQSEIRNK
ncbi:MAG: DUF4174 domain-containing protein [Cecembia sp.]